MKKLFLLLFLFLPLSFSLLGAHDASMSMNHSKYNRGNTGNLDYDSNDSDDELGKLVFDNLTTLTTLITLITLSPSNIYPINVF